MRKNTLSYAAIEFTAIPPSGGMAVYSMAAYERVLYSSTLMFRYNSNKNVPFRNKVMFAPPYSRIIYQWIYH